MATNTTTSGDNNSGLDTGVLLTKRIALPRDMIC